MSECRSWNAFFILGTRLRHNIAVYTINGTATAALKPGPKLFIYIHIAHYLIMQNLIKVYYIMGGGFGPVAISKFDSKTACWANIIICMTVCWGRTLLLV